MTAQLGHAHDGGKAAVAMTPVAAVLPASSDTGNLTGVVLQPSTAKAGLRRFGFKSRALRIGDQRAASGEALEEGTTLSAHYRPWTRALLLPAGLSKDIMRPTTANRYPDMLVAADMPSASADAVPGGTKRRVDAAEPPLSPPKPPEAIMFTADGGSKRRASPTSVAKHDPATVAEAAAPAATAPAATAQPIFRAPAVVASVAAPPRRPAGSVAAASDASAVPQAGCSRMPEQPSAASSVAPRPSSSAVPQQPASQPPAAAVPLAAAAPTAPPKPAPPPQQKQQQQRDALPLRDQRPPAPLPAAAKQPPAASAGVPLDAATAAAEAAVADAEAARVQPNAREDAQSVYVRGVRYTKLECVGRGGSSKVRSGFIGFATAIAVYAIPDASLYKHFCSTGDATSMRDLFASRRCTR